ncbi:ferredoxin [Nocardia vaccinii]|uniref:ferredoxin n=1 Tax=Nocardia vaccinii TaxID=1822 RepID=UPI001FE17687|nr:ferredoxin [Nocardia vaccinii]
MCESLAPEYFAVQPDGSLVVTDNIPDEEAETLEEAVRTCPTQALGVGEATG